jgi:hypothetical protein
MTLRGEKRKPWRWWWFAVGALILVGVGTAAGIFSLPKMLLRSAKAAAIKQYAGAQYAGARVVLNAIPARSPREIRPAEEFTNSVSVTVAGRLLRLPADRFTRDRDPRRENMVVHHARYRVLISAGADGKDWETVMGFTGHTNLYELLESAFAATERGIMAQPNLAALRRHQILLKTKSMMACVGFEDLCLKFVCGDRKGFIIGDPKRSKHQYVLVYVESAQRFIDLSIIQEARIEMSDIEEMISGLRIAKP